MKMRAARPIVPIMRLSHFRRARHTPSLGVTRRAILDCGATDLEGGQPATRASTGCGGCAPRVRSLLAEAAEVGFQAVQVEPAEAIEVLVRGPVEVGRAGRQ